MPATDRRYPVETRVVAHGTWTATSAIHLGGDVLDANVDMSLARDAHGNFYVPGASIAGATRSLLARTEADNFREFQSGVESHVLAMMYGRHLTSDKLIPAYASLTRFEQAPCEKTIAPFVRDSVRIDSTTGNAAHRGKFNQEVLPAGVAFRLEIHLSIWEQLPENLTRDEVRQSFRHILETFTEDGVRLGAKTRKGFGRGSVASWTIREFDMRERKEALDWLQDKGAAGGREIGLDDLGTGKLAPPLERLTIDATFRIRTSLLVRGRSAETNGPDTTQFNENGIRLVPGTSLTGILRHRVERIVNTLGGNGDEVCTDLFGNDRQKLPPREEKGEPTIRKEKAGRVWVTEAVLGKGQTPVQSRVSIDRFTGGSLEARLFDEAPFWGDPTEQSHLAVQIVVDAPRSHERQALLGAFKDLWTGDLPVGGESAVGRGVLEGVAARFVETGPQGLPVMTWRRDPQKPERVIAEGAAEWHKHLGG